MQYVGFALLGAAVIGVIIGFVQRMKMKSILAAPFKKTGEIAANPGVADEKGNISAEGAVSAEQALTAPCSEKACVYYEVKAERLWEKKVQTENGTKTEKGKDNLESETRGLVFNLDDGSGPVKVDAQDKVTGDLAKSFSQTKSASFGTVTFGKYEVNVPSSSGDKKTTGVKVKETIIPAEGNLFVMGKLEAGTVKHKDGMMGKLLLSTRGRDKLVGATKRNMIIAFVLGGLCLPPGIFYAVTGKPPVDNCANMHDSLAAQCTGRITSQQGETLSWSVTQAGNYTFTVAGTGTDANNRLWPKVTVTNAAGQAAMVAEQGNGMPVVSTVAFAPGAYTIHITDAAVTDWAERMKGGVGYSLDIKSAGGAPAALPAAAPAAAPAAPAAAPAAPAAQ